MPIKKKSLGRIDVDIVHMSCFFLNGNYRKPNGKFKKGNVDRLSIIFLPTIYEIKAHLTPSAFAFRQVFKLL